MAKQAIRLLTSYAKSDGSTRYVAVLEDNTMWWYMPGHPWQPSSMVGLPANKQIVQISAYLRKGDTRYVVVLDDQTIWWFMPNHQWQRSPLDGLPADYTIRQFNVYLKNGDTRYVALLGDNSIWWYAPGHTWQNSTLDGMPEATVVVPASVVDMPMTENVSAPQPQEQLAPVHDAPLSDLPSFENETESAEIARFRLPEDFHFPPAPNTPPADSTTPPTS